jgi:hypothetical protein
VNDGGSYNGEARISISSILLLVIFVSAAALIVVAAIWRPWFGDDSPAAQANQPQVTATANTAVQEPVDTPDTGGPMGP